MSKNFKRALLVIVLALLVYVGVNVMGSSEGFLFDYYVLDKIHSNINPLTTKIMKGFSFLGSKYVMILALVVLVVYFMNKKERRNARLVFMSIAGSYVTNAVLKLIFRRTRPIDYMIVEKSGYSFPSGHSMVSMSFYTTITYIIVSKMDRGSKGLKALLWIVNCLLIFFIGYSRLYLGVHWPTDVLMGFILGNVIYHLGKEKIKN